MAARGGGRNPRQRQARGRSLAGERFTVEVGPVAHGGHCVARVAEHDNRVVFVRHTLPGETVVVEITEGTEGDRFWRGDAVSVVTASPDRVEAPCRFSGPGLCGGCDFQHVALPAQRALKTAVVREQLVRLGRLDPEDPLVSGLVVQAVSGDDHGLRWRTRVEYAVAPDGSPGMRKHRSRDVIPIDDCLIAAVPPPKWRASSPEVAGVVVRSGNDDPSVPVVERVETTHGAREFMVAADGFWQVHPGAPTVLVESVLEFLDPQPGERALDLYAGVGLFAAYLAEHVGERGRVVAVEGDRGACSNAKGNLGEFRHARVAAGSVDHVLATAYDEPFDLVVLDPPREGAKRKVVDQVVDRAPRAVAYVACDPAALSRDVALFAEHGYRLIALRAFDLFPMTHHIECVALLEKTGSDLR
jgi:tRNA/tmRNA/rRNA uracil-C5-methylase (TrmA/RlmC/RlmD family)